MTDDSGPESAARLVQDAQAILASHTANDHGFCAGCLDQWARLALHPCLQSRWATAIVDRHDTGR